MTAAAIRSSQLSEDEPARAGSPSLRQRRRPGGLHREEQTRSCAGELAGQGCAGGQGSCPVGNATELLEVKSAIGCGASGPLTQFEHLLIGDRGSTRKR
jgi:hypothetical protein